MSFWAFNENGDYQEYDCSTSKVTCNYCGKEYRQTVEEQIPGFRDKSYDICPYCKQENGSSMEVDYYNQKI